MHLEIKPRSVLEQASTRRGDRVRWVGRSCSCDEEAPLQENMAQLIEALRAGLFFTAETERCVCSACLRKRTLREAGT